MHWATKRQLLIALGIMIALAIIGVGVFFGFVYDRPSCMDQTQNGKEEGVDCGGACEKLCAGPLVSVTWARAVKVAPGVYHGVALIKNPDTTAKGVVPYTVSLYDDAGVLIGKREGMIALAPGEVTPIFEANLQAGSRVPARAFAELGAGTWKRAERGPLPIVLPSFTLNATTTVLTATVQNDGAAAMDDISVTALVYDASATLIAASQTIVDTLAPRERKDIVFTWQEPFSTAPARVDLIPHIAIP